MPRISFNIPFPYNESAFTELLYWGNILENKSNEDEQQENDVTEKKTAYGRISESIAVMRDELRQSPRQSPGQSNSSVVNKVTEDVMDKKEKRGRPRKTALVEDTAAYKNVVSKEDADMAAAITASVESAAAFFNQVNNHETVNAEENPTKTLVQSPVNVEETHTGVVSSVGNNNVSVSGSFAFPPGYQIPAFPSFHASPVIEGRITLEELRAHCVETQKTHPGLFMRIMRRDRWANGEPKLSVVTLERVPEADRARMLDEIANESLTLG